MLLFNGCRIVTPDRVLSPGWLLASEGQIAAMGEGTPTNEALGAAVTAAGTACEVVEAFGLTLLPGFIDIHVHGAVGRDTMDASTPGLQAMGRFLAMHGVTSFLPTTWAAARQPTLDALHAISNAMRDPPQGSAIAGAHMEGPYLNPKRAGAQSPIAIRPADREEALAFLDTGVVRLLGLAPEVPENRWLIDECVARHVTVAASHTGASYDQVLDAVNGGLRHVTHTYNAMTSFDHRAPGVVGAALTSKEVSCELIADNIHVHPAAMMLLVAARGIDAVVLISDATRACGLPEGDYLLDTRRVVQRDGAVRLPDGTLAGSVLTLDQAFRNLKAATGLSVLELWPAASRNAARVIGLDGVTGSIEIGRQADLVLLDASLEVVFTVVRGKLVYKRTSNGRQGSSRSYMAPPTTPGQEADAGIAGSGRL